LEGKAAKFKKSIKRVFGERNLLKIKEEIRKGKKEE